MDNTESSNVAPKMCIAVETGVAFFDITGNSLILLEQTLVLLLGPILVPLTPCENEKK